MISPEERAKRGKRLTLGFDLICALSAMIIAAGIWLRFDASNRPWWGDIPAIALMAAIFTVSAMVSFMVTRVHLQVWRHMGWSDAVRVVQAALLAALIAALAVVLIDMIFPLPGMAVLLALPIWLAMLFIGRMIALALSTERPLQLFRKMDKDAPRVLLVGASGDVVAALRGPARKRQINVLGILTTDAPEKGRSIQGVSLYGGVEALGDTIDLMAMRYGRAPWVAIVGEIRNLNTTRAIARQVAERGAKLMVLDGASRQRGLRKLRTGDLLGRTERELDPAPLRQMIEGRRILVTGAGGSIGSALVQICAKFAPAHIALYDSSEFNLYTIDTRLADSHPDLPRRAMIGDVRDPVRLSQAIALARPDVILHAAALKHVPMVEENPCEAVLTNVQGVLAVAEAAARAGAERFVFISSDKAASPTNAMGATKRLAEDVLTAFAAKSPAMTVSMVRFGNVLGSSGSVVPRFEAQIAEGGPVTVTHPDATRYFMTIEEAARLVLTTAAHANGGGEAQLFMLDMGEPVRVLDLAETMIRMSGQLPYRDIDIVFTDLRAGDRLHEALVNDRECMEPSGLAGVHRVRPTCGARLDDAALARLLDAARHRDEAATRKWLSVLVRDYHPPAEDTPDTA